MKDLLPALLLCCFLPTINTLAQVVVTDEEDVFYHENLEEALKNPAKIGSLELKCTASNIALFVENAGKFTTLSTLAFSGRVEPAEMDRLLKSLVFLPRLVTLKFIYNELSEVPPALQNVRGLNRVVVEGSKNLDFHEFFLQLSKNNDLRIIHLENNELDHLPSSVKKFKNLERVFITGNHDLDLERSIEQLKSHSRLIELALPVNLITELPKNIGKLDQLSILGLRGNNIARLPASMAKMEKLLVLNLEDNLIADPVKELERLKTLDIRMLSLDSGLSEDEYKALRKLFPNARVEEVKDEFWDRVKEEAEIKKEEMKAIRDTPAGEDSETEITDLTIEAAEDSITHLTIPDAASEPEFPEAPAAKKREFKVKSKAFKAYSMAYLRFPGLFDIERLKEPFDSLTFEERYDDTTYAYTYKQQPGYEEKEIRLTSVKGAKGEIWFDFYREPTAKRIKPYHVYLATHHAELNAFMGMHWVYAGELDKKEFKERFLKKRHFSDVRIKKNADEDNFTIELKHRRGFEKIKAYPRYPNPKVDLEKSQKTYTKRYERYTFNLLRKAERYNRRLLKQKDAHFRMLDAKREAAWKQLGHYMSDKEKAMSRAEWLAYYDEVIADEEFALHNSPASAGSIMQSLELDEYEVIDYKEDWFKIDSLKRIFADFQDSELRKLASQRIVVVDMANKKVQSYKGSLSNVPVFITINTESPTVLIVELRNGDIAIVNSDYFERNNLKANDSHTFTTEVYDKKLSSVGMIRKVLGLE